MSKGTCPICGKAGDAGFRPFCSARCADVDLHRWLTGSYAIASKGTEEEESAPVPGQQPEP